MSTNGVVASTSFTVEEICASVMRSPSLETGIWPVDFRDEVLMPCTHSCCSCLELFRRPCGSRAVGKLHGLGWYDTSTYASGSCPVGVMNAGHYKSFAGVSNCTN